MSATVTITELPALRPPAGLADAVAAVPDTTNATVYLETARAVGHGWSLTQTCERTGYTPDEHKDALAALGSRIGKSIKADNLIATVTAAADLTSHGSVTTTDTGAHVTVAGGWSKPRRNLSRAYAMLATAEDSSIRTHIDTLTAATLRPLTDHDFRDLYLADTWGQWDLASLRAGTACVRSWARAWEHLRQMLDPARHTLFAAAAAADNHAFPAALAVAYACSWLDPNPDLLSRVTTHLDSAHTNLALAQDAARTWHRGLKKSLHTTPDVVAPRRLGHLNDHTWKILAGHALTEPNGSHISLSARVSRHQISATLAAHKHQALRILVTARQPPAVR